MQICEPYELHKIELREKSDEDIAMQVCEPYELCKVKLQDEVIYDDCEISTDDYKF